MTSQVARGEDFYSKVDLTTRVSVMTSIAAAPARRNAVAQAPTIALVVKTSSTISTLAPRALFAIPLRAANAPITLRRWAMALSLPWDGVCRVRTGKTGMALIAVSRPIACASAAQPARERLSGILALVLLTETRHRVTV